MCVCVWSVPNNLELLGLNPQFTCTLDWVYTTMGEPKKWLVVSLMVLRIFLGLNYLTFSLVVNATKQSSPLSGIWIGLPSPQNVFLSCLSPQFFQPPISLTLSLFIPFFKWGRHDERIFCASGPHGSVGMSGFFSDQGRCCPGSNPVSIRRPTFWDGGDLLVTCVWRRVHVRWVEVPKALSKILDYRDS